jgi:hypothetical protein
MALEPVDLILISLFAGIGSGIGNPIGQEIYRAWIRKHIDKIFKGTKKATSRN